MNLRDKISLIKEHSSEEILNGASHNGTPLLRFVLEAYEEYFGMACKHCSDKLPAYIKEIQSINLNNKLMSSKDRKYRMKSGSTIHRKGTNEYYSDMNITDEIAEDLLKENLNRKVLFAKIPEGAIKRLEKERDEENKQEAEAQKAAEEAARKEEEAKKEREEAEAQAKAEHEKALESGDLNAEQLDAMSMDEIRDYAKKHNYEFGSRANKDELVKQVAAKKVVTEKE